MNEKKPESSSDIVDRVTAELRSLPTPPMPSELLGKMLHAATDDVACAPVDVKTLERSYSDNVGVQPLSRLQKIKVIIMKNPLKSFTTFAACCAAVVAVYLAVAPMSRGNAAFAEVCEIIQKAKSVVFTQIQRTPNASEIAHKSLVQYFGEKKSKIMITESGCARTEAPNNVVVSNLAAGGTLTYNPDTKTATLIKISNVPKKMGQTNILEILKKASKNPHTKELGVEVVDGREVKGYLTEEYIGTVTLWIDTHSGDLVKVVIENRLPSGNFVLDKKELISQSILCDFQFDVPLDESLFSLTPPEGYQVTVEEMDFSNSDEKTLIEVLRDCAKYGNDLFPDSLKEKNITLIVSKGIMMQSQEENKKTKEEDKTRIEKLKKPLSDFSKLCSKAGLFLEENRGWHYAGKGVKLGDAQTPIFWYLPKDSKQGRVIYGDLSARDVPLDQLPPDPEEKK